jgi:hypothetical protein
LERRYGCYKSFLGGEPLLFYTGNGFIIDVPPAQSSLKLIVIKKQEMSDD